MSAPKKLNSRALSKLDKSPTPTSKVSAWAASSQTASVEDEPGSMSSPPPEASSWDEWIAHARTVATAPRIQARVELLSGELIARIEKGELGVPV